MSFIAASPEAASARQMSRLPGYIGAVAFTRSGYPDVGWYDPVEILKQFGCFRKALWVAF
jgi:hypothetical protein